MVDAVSPAGRGIALDRIEREIDAERRKATRTVDAGGNHAHVRGEGRAIDCTPRIRWPSMSIPAGRRTEAKPTPSRSAMSFSCRAKNAQLPVSSSGRCRPPASGALDASAGSSERHSSRVSRRCGYTRFGQQLARGCAAIHFMLGAEQLQVAGGLLVVDCKAIAQRTQLLAAVVGDALHARLVADKSFERTFGVPAQQSSATTRDRTSAGTRSAHAAGTGTPAPCAACRVAPTGRHTRARSRRRCRNWSLARHRSCVQSPLRRDPPGEGNKRW